MEERHHLLHPLLTPSTTTAAALPPDDHAVNYLNLMISSNSGIFFRLCMVALVGIVSIWANHEASKGYAITILNESPNTLAGSRFQLFYVSNEEATRIVIKSSNTIENLLYRDPSSSIRKPIKSVVVKLASRNLTDNVAVESSHDQFVLNISPSIMGGKNFDRDDVARSIRQGVVRIWLWDGQGSAPKNLVNGIVEYLVNSLDGTAPSHDEAELLEPAAVCWNSGDRRVVAGFLERSERRRPGFIISLNEAMRDGWSDERFGGALGLPVHKLCAISKSLRYNSSSV